MAPRLDASRVATIVAAGKAGARDGEAVALGTRHSCRCEGLVSIATVWPTMPRPRPGALCLHRYVCIDPLTNTHRASINALALEARLPTMHDFRGIVATGGLMSYGPDFLAQFRRVAELVDKILRGAKPGDIPVEQADKFELVVNLKTAKLLGLTIPESFLLRADAVIE